MDRFGVSTAKSPSAARTPPSCAERPSAEAGIRPAASPRAGAGPAAVPVKTTSPRRQPAEKRVGPTEKRLEEAERDRLAAAIARRAPASFRPPVRALPASRPQPQDRVRPGGARGALPRATAKSAGTAPGQVAWSVAHLADHGPEQDGFSTAVLTVSAVPGPLAQREIALGRIAEDSAQSGSGGIFRAVQSTISSMEDSIRHLRDRNAPDNAFSRGAVAAGARQGTTRVVARRRNPGRGGATVVPPLYEVHGDVVGSELEIADVLSPQSGGDLMRSVSKEVGANSESASPGIGSAPTREVSWVSAVAVSRLPSEIQPSGEAEAGDIDVGDFAAVLMADGRLPRRALFSDVGRRLSGSSGRREVIERIADDHVNEEVLDGNPQEDASGEKMLDYNP